MNKYTIIIIIEVLDKFFKDTSDLLKQIIVKDLLPALKDNRAQIKYKNMCDTISYLSLVYLAKVWQH